MFMQTENSSSSGVYPKLCSIVVLPLASIIAGSLPLKLGKYFRSSNHPHHSTAFDKAVSFFLFFGGGLLLCTIFLHLLPEIRESVKKLQEETLILDQFPLPFSELALCVGFFMMYAVEETLHSCLFSKHNHRTSVSNQGVGLSKPVFLVDKSEENCAKSRTPENVCSKGSAEQEHINSILDSSKNYHSCSDHMCLTGRSPLPHHFHHTHDHSHLHTDPNQPLLAGLFIVIALSVHELFEGLALGLEKKPSMVWYLLIALSCHKVVLAAFIGVQLLVSKVKHSIAYLYLVAFAITTPAGIAIGLFMSTDDAGTAESIMPVSLQALATGTLLYIVFFEVFAKQIGTRALHGMVKFLASISGFSFMALLQILLH